MSDGTTRRLRRKMLSTAHGLIIDMLLYIILQVRGFVDDHQDDRSVGFCGETESV